MVVVRERERVNSRIFHPPIPLLYLSRFLRYNLSRQWWYIREHMALTVQPIDSRRNSTVSRMFLSCR